MKKQRTYAPPVMKPREKICQFCGNPFIAIYGHTKYCAGCRLKAYKAISSELHKKRYEAERDAIKQKYIDGVIYVCNVCGRKIRVHGRTTRKTCDDCLQNMGYYGMRRMMNRMPLDEEEVQDV